MKSYSLRLLLVFSALLMLLGGCTASIPLRQDVGSTLPPISAGLPAPLGDGGDSFAQPVMLCLPSQQTGQLGMFSERILLSHSRHPAENTIKKLLSFTGNEQARPLNDHAQLSLNPGFSLEVSGEVVTVDLAANALSLSSKERYVIARAIVQTLTQWGDIKYVNLLINGRQPGLDTAASIPLGSLGRSESLDTEDQYEAATRQASSASSYTAMATLYFPTYSGRGILAEPRAIEIKDGSMDEMSLALLRALSTGSASLGTQPKPPDLESLLMAAPEVHDAPGGSGKVISLHFHERANEAFISAGIPRSLMMASLSYTLTTFLPHTTAIKVRIGQEQVEALVPSGLYEGAGEQIHFDGGIMQRSQFNRFLLDQVTLYFANEQGGLVATRRALPHFLSHSPRYLLEQLVLGPQGSDSQAGLVPVLPAGIRDADLLGISRQGDALLVHFSQHLIAQCQGLDPKAERLMVYAMVNSLTGFQGLKRVRFYIDGKQDGFFASTIDLAGDFLRNEGIIQR